MTRIAVLISGEYRTFKHCRKSMTFLDSPMVDVYVSTWNVTTNICKKINLSVTESVTEKTILDDLGKTPHGMLIDDLGSFVQKKYNSAMIYRWLRGIELIKNSNIQYDYVIVVRPDLFFSSNTPIRLDKIDAYKNKLGTIWTADLQTSAKLADVILVSDFHTMEKIFNNLTIQGWEDTTVYDWHIFWFNHCVSCVEAIIQATEFQDCIFYRCLVEPGVTNMAKIHQGYLDWRDLQLLQHYDECGQDMTAGPVAAWPKKVVLDAIKKWDSQYFNKYQKHV
jgi:hypothetical protein